jgi:hypothetical protein
VSEASGCEISSVYGSLVFFMRGSRAVGPERAKRAEVKETGFGYLEMDNGRSERSEWRWKRLNWDGGTKHRSERSERS